MNNKEQAQQAAEDWRNEYTNDYPPSGIQGFLAGAQWQSSQTPAALPEIQKEALSLHPKVLQFALWMQHKLDNNKFEDKQEWELCKDVAYLLELFKKHRIDFQKALEKADRDKIKESIADIANVLLIIGNAGDLYNYELNEFLYTSQQYSDIRFHANRFTHLCRLRGITTNNDTVNLWDNEYSKNIKVDNQSLPAESGGEKMYRWVKCSERLPEYGYISPVRYLHGKLMVVNAKYIDLCNGKPRWEEDVDSRPQIFNGIIEWLEEVSPSQLPSLVNLTLEDLKRIKEGVQWMWDNMGKVHTADHFNIPANVIQNLEDAINAYPSPVTPVRSAEEVFKKNFVVACMAHDKCTEQEAIESFNSDIRGDNQIKKTVYDSMEEYANQFKGTTPACTRCRQMDKCGRSIAGVGG